MRVIREIHSNKSVNEYEFDVTQDMKDRALDFADTIINGNNQYLRLSPIEVKNASDLEKQKLIEIQRTYIGKIGELIFLEYLRSCGIKDEFLDMFQIYEGKSNVDTYDFITPNNHTVDVKTGFRYNHKNLLVNLEQFQNVPKDYYVAVLLNARDIDPRARLVDFKSVTKGVIKGYADHSFLSRFARVEDMGEGDAKIYPYNRLLGIDRLIREEWR